MLLLPKRLVTEAPAVNQLHGLGGCRDPCLEPWGAVPCTPRQTVERNSCFSTPRGAQGHWQLQLRIWAPVLALHVPLVLGVCPLTGDSGAMLAPVSVVCNH